MHKIPFITLLVISLSWFVQCTTPGQDSDKLVLNELDDQIREMLSEVSADTLEKNIRRLAEFGTRHTLSETESDTFGIGAARRWIKAEMDRYGNATAGRLDVEFHRFIQEPGGRIVDPVEIVNVVATLPGSDPNDDRVFVVSGHYDSRASDVMDAESLAPGANDDASGTAAVLELARVMSRHEFPATLVFMTVAGEEQGLLGARQWAEDAAAEGMNIAGMITNDIIGNHAAEENSLVAPNTVRIFSQGIPLQRELDNETLQYIQTGGENDLPPRQLARTIKEVSESYLPDTDVWMVYRRDRYLRGGDHISFLEQGYPAVRFSEPNEEFRYQHQDVREENGLQYGDLPEFVDYPYVARVTRINLAALANLARSPKPPRNAGMVVTNLENDTRLRWESSESAHLAGYEVLWRETSAPVWQQRVFVGHVTEYTVELTSKDNYLFGIRSVSEGGHVGVPVYPVPVR
ncbi:MAG: M28 family metallopeptidase [Balneolaceae bacterium]